MEQKDKLCDEVLTVQELTYLGDRVSAGRGCEAAVTARTRDWWARSRESSELLYGRRFHLKLKLAVYEDYVRPAILYVSKAWCLKERWEGANKWSSPTTKSIDPIVVTVHMVDFPVENLAPATYM